MKTASLTPPVFFMDLTGRPAIYDGRRPGRRISWEESADQTGRAIPAGALSRPRRRAENPEPLPAREYWLDDRPCRFPMRWSDNRYHWRGWKVFPRPVVETPMQELLRPLSAKVTARHYYPCETIPDATPPRRSPFLEEHASGRISERHYLAAEWFMRSLDEDPATLGGGASKSDGAGGMVQIWSRNPFALWPMEIAWDRMTRLRHRFRSLGSLAHVLLRALDGAEMRDLAPAWSIPQRHLPEAGRIRLRAALEVCARMRDHETERLPWREVAEIEKAACAECERLVSTRRMRVLRPDNDNVPMLKAA